MNDRDLNASSVSSDALDQHQGLQSVAAEPSPEKTARITGALAEKPSSEIQWTLDSRAPEPLALLCDLWDQLSPEGRLVCATEEAKTPEEAMRRLAFSVLVNVSGFALEPEDSSIDAVSIVLRKKKRRFTFERVRKADASACRALFKAVFAHEISSSLWVWKYGEGRGQSLLARSADGLVVGHYGALSRTLLADGKTLEALQVADVMSAPSVQARLTRNGVFSQLAQGFQALHFGWHDRFAFAFGFPTVRALALGERLGLYQTMDRVSEMAWSPGKGWDPFAPRFEPVEHLRCVRDLLSGLWFKMAEGLNDQVLIQRTPDYLEMRYLNHPVHQYRLMLAKSRWTRKIQGLVVVRFDQEDIRLMDLIAPPKQVPGLIRGLRHWMQRQGARRLLAWSASSQQRYFAETDFSLTATEIAIPLNAVFSRASLPSLQGRWWVSMGDADFL